MHQINNLNCSDGAYIKHPSTGGTTAYTVNNMNQYTTAGGTAMTYSADGCLTKNGANTLQYDTENHLTKQIQTGANLTFVYDPILQRQAQVKPNGTVHPTRYIYDGMRLIATYDATTDSLLNRFVPGVKPDEFVMQVSSAGSVSYNHADWLSPVTAVTNSAGVIAALAAFDVFGQGARITLNGQPFGFTGQIGNGLFADYNFKARYYSPALGRFYQPDPIPSDLHLNLYAYVSNDPINNVDSNGALLTVVGGRGPGPLVHPPLPGVTSGTRTGAGVAGPNIIMNEPQNSGNGSSDKPGDSGSGGKGDRPQSPGDDDENKNKPKPGDTGKTGDLVKVGDYTYDKHVFDRYEERNGLPFEAGGQQMVEDAIEHGSSRTHGGATFYTGSSGVEVVVRGGVVETVYFPED